MYISIYLSRRVSVPSGGGGGQREERFFSGSYSGHPVAAAYLGEGRVLSIVLMDVGQEAG